MSTIPSLHKLFTYYRSLGEKAIAQVKDEDLHRMIGEDGTPDVPPGNSIAVIIQHLSLIHIS